MSSSEDNSSVGLEIWMLLSIILMFDKWHVCFVCPLVCIVHTFSFFLLSLVSIMSTFSLCN